MGLDLLSSSCYNILQRTDTLDPESDTTADVSGVEVMLKHREEELWSPLIPSRWKLSREVNKPQLLHLSSYSLVKVQVNHWHLPSGWWS